MSKLGSLLPLLHARFEMEQLNSGDGNKKIDNTHWARGKATPVLLRWNTKKDLLAL